MQSFKYVFIGSGASTVFAVLNLLKNNIKGEEILVLDKGKDPYKRDKSEILNGYLGAGLFSDAKFIYSLHPDLILFDYMSKGKIEEHYKFIQDMTVEFHPNPSTINITEPTTPYGLKAKNGWGEVAIKESLCHHIGSQYGVKLGEKWYDYTVENNVTILQETEFLSLDENKKIIDTSKGRFKYENLFLAFGKTGSKQIENIYNQLGLLQYNDEAHIGVRFETEFNPTIQEVVKEQYDFKFTQNNARTFCCCSGSAYLAEEKFSNSISSRIQYNGEGYGLYNKEKYNDLTNFGILITVKKKNANLIVDNIVEKLGNQGIVVEGDNTTYKSSLENLPKKISKGEFRDLFEDSGVEVGKEILGFIDNLKPILGFEENYRFFGPEIKEMGNRVELLPDMSIKGFPEIHIIGDLMGTKGIVPAAVTGIQAVSKFQEVKVL